MAPPQLYFGAASIGAGNYATTAQTGELINELKTLDVLHIDTAAVYTGGNSEQVLGENKALLDEGFTVDTKILIGQGQFSGALSAANIDKSVAESIKKLGVKVHTTFFEWNSRPIMAKAEHDRV